MEKTEEDGIGFGFSLASATGGHKADILGDSVSSQVVDVDYAMLDFDSPDESGLLNQRSGLVLVE